MGKIMSLLSESKPKALFFHTNYIAEMKDIEIKDGKIKVENKEFIADRVKPFFLKHKGKLVPLYLLYWRVIEPLNFDVVERKLPEGDYIEYKQRPIVKELKQLEFKAKEPDKKDILPELLDLITDMKFLKNLGKYPRGEEEKKKFKFQKWMLIPIALGVSFLINVVYFVILGGGGV